MRHILTLLFLHCRSHGAYPDHEDHPNGFFVVVGLVVVETIVVGACVVDALVVCRVVTEAVVVMLGVESFVVILSVVCCSEVFDGVSV